MSSKTQKRQAQRHKEEQKAAEEHMKNLDEKAINALINYSVMQILYINDAAFNCCKQLGDELSKIPYKSNAVRKVYGALMKRWQVHRDILESPDLDQDSVAELFGEIDGYVDKNIDSFRDAVKGVLERENVEHADWIADVETANTLCSYAVQIAKDIIEGLVKVDKRASFFTLLMANEPKRVMGNMSELVQSIHVKKEIELNTEPTVQASFRKLNKQFISAENFINAQHKADAENRANGRMVIMS